MRPRHVKAHNMLARPLPTLGRNEHQRSRLGRGVVGAQGIEPWTSPV